MVFQRLFGKRTLLLALVGVMSVALVACGDDDNGGNGGGTSTPTATADGSGGGIDYGSIQGSVRIDGSSTVFPISEAVAEEFSKVARGVRADVGFSGTGGGFEKFCRGEIHVSDASRPIKDSEVEACAANGITDIVEIQVAIDALTVMVNPQNDWASCLTVQQVHDIFRNGGFTNWNEIDFSFPDARISGYVPGTDSGTFDYFVEAIIDGVGEDGTHRGDFTASEDDNILAQGLQNDRNAIGYFGFAYFLEAGQSLKSLAIDGGDGCVEPSFEAALDGSYTPLSRPLYVYTREGLLAEDEAVRGFVNFYLENMQDLVPDVGYVTMPEDLYQEQVAKIEPFVQ